VSCVEYNKEQRSKNLSDPDPADPRRNRIEKYTTERNFQESRVQIQIRVSLGRKCQGQGRQSRMSET
jgi:hypothetical protein